MPNLLKRLDEGFGLASGSRGAIRRRRECEHCQERFTTYERLDVGATGLERAVVEFIRGLDATTEEMTT